MITEATFVRSAASANDLPRDGLAEIAMVGRSNVGKSTLINALTRQRVARTSAAPGKTRLANIYRVVRGGRDPLYLVDLPGYGYARGGDDSATELAAVARAYFEHRDSRFASRGSDDADDSTNRESRTANRGGERTNQATLLLIDSRHPGLDLDLDAHRWLTTVAGPPQIVATKVDKLSRSDRVRNLKELERVFGCAPLPVSAAGGEGLDELWRLIAKVAREQRQ